MTQTVSKGFFSKIFGGFNKSRDAQTVDLISGKTFTKSTHDHSRVNLLEEPHLLQRVQYQQGPIWLSKWNQSGTLLATAGSNQQQKQAIKRQLQQAGADFTLDEDDDDINIPTGCIIIWATIGSQYCDQINQRFNHNHPSEFSSRPFSPSDDITSMGCAQGGRPVIHPIPYKILFGHVRDVISLDWSENNFLVSSGVDFKSFLWYIDITVPNQSQDDANNNINLTTDGDLYDAFPHNNNTSQQVSFVSLAQDGYTSPFAPKTAQNLAVPTSSSNASQLSQHNEEINDFLYLTPVQSFPHPDVITSCHFFPNTEQFIITTCFDHFARVFDVISGTLVHSVYIPKTVACLAFSPSIKIPHYNPNKPLLDDQLSTVSPAYHNTAIYFTSPSEATPQAPLDCEELIKSRLGACFNDEIVLHTYEVAFGHYDGEISLYNILNWGRICLMQVKNRHGEFSKGSKVTSLEYSHDGRMLLICTNDSRIRLLYRDLFFVKPSLYYKVLFEHTNLYLNAKNSIFSDVLMYNGDAVISSASSHTPIPTPPLSTKNQDKLFSSISNALIKSTESDSRSPFLLSSLPLNVNDLRIVYTSFNTVRKFKGFTALKFFISASFTPDYRYICCGSENGHVYFFYNDFVPQQNLYDLILTQVYFVDQLIMQYAQHLSAHYSMLHPSPAPTNTAPLNPFSIEKLSGGDIDNDPMVILQIQLYNELITNFNQHYLSNFDVNYTPNALKSQSASMTSNFTLNKLPHLLFVSSLNPGQLATNSSSASIVQSQPISSTAELKDFNVGCYYYMLKNPNLIISNYKTNNDTTKQSSHCSNPNNRFKYDLEDDNDNENVTSAAESIETYKSIIAAYNSAIKTEYVLPTFLTPQPATSTGGSSSCSMKCALSTPGGCSFKSLTCCHCSSTSLLSQPLVYLLDIASKHCDEYEYLSIGNLAAQPSQEGEKTDGKEKNKETATPSSITEDDLYNDDSEKSHKDPQKKRKFGILSSIFKKDKKDDKNTKKEDNSRRGNVIAPESSVIHEHPEFTSRDTPQISTATNTLNSPHQTPSITKSTSFSSKSLSNSLRLGENPLFQSNQDDSDSTDSLHSAPDESISEDEGGANVLTLNNSIKREGHIAQKGSQPPQSDESRRGSVDSTGMGVSSITPHTTTSTNTSASASKTKVKSKSTPHQQASKSGMDAELFEKYPMTITVAQVVPLVTTLINHKYGNDGAPFQNVATLLLMVCDIHGNILFFENA